MTGPAGTPPFGTTTQYGTSAALENTGHSARIATDGDDQTVVDPTTLVAPSAVASSDGPDAAVRR